MLSILYVLGMVVGDLVRSRARLEAEILLLRHQLNAALRHVPPRARLRGGDRVFMVWDGSVMAEPARCGPGCSAGDRVAMAPSGVPSLLALEVAEAVRAAED